VLTLLCVVLAVPWPAAAVESRNVLVLYSSSRLLPANVEGDAALRAAIKTSAAHPVEFYDEYLDIPRFGGEAYVKTIVTYLHEKYAQRPPDVVVAGGSDALEFTLQNRAQLFPDTPVVHLSVSPEFLRALAPLPAGVIGVPVAFDYAGSIALALKWQPDTKHLVLVTGANTPDRAWEARLRNDVKAFEKRVSIEFLTALPTADLHARLAALGRDTIVFTPGYFDDGAGRLFAPRESVALMAAVSSAPVYGPFNTFIGTGVVGGRMPSYGAMGRQAGGIVNALLDGAAPDSLALPAAGVLNAHIDWRQARRFGIRESDVSPDTVVHFKDPTFWEEYRGVALIGTAVVLVQSALIVALLLQMRRRRETAAALEYTERRMSLAVRAASLSVWDWDASGKVLEFAHPADRPEVEQAIARALAGDEDLDVEYRVQSPGSEPRWLAVYARREKGHRKQLLGVARDITERKLVELHAERDRSALQHMARVSTLGQLSASIAHQLNQPLAAILANAEAAQTMLARDDVDLAELREICDDIVSEDHRAADVIRRLGALFKRGDLRKHALDVNELVRETLELARTDLLMRHVTPVIELDEDLPAIEGDRVQLQQLLLNLIVNAADAMSKTPEAHRTVTLQTERKGPEVQISVADRGTGVPVENLLGVFDPFWTTKPGGMGIGLALCRSIAEAHRGSLTAANRADGGALFSFTLPASAPS
jgi:signal transduction histidine kinase